MRAGFSRQSNSFQSGSGRFEYWFSAKYSNARSKITNSEAECARSWRCVVWLSALALGDIPLRTGRKRDRNRRRQRPGGRRRSRRHRHRDQRRHQPAAGRDDELRGRVHGARPGAGRLSRRRGALRLQARPPRGHPCRHGTDDTTRFRAERRRRSRAGQGQGRDAAPPGRVGQPGRRDRKRPGRAAAAQRANVHHAGDARPRRRAASRHAAAAYQRRPAAHQRVPVRRHLGAAAGAGPGRLLSDHRRDPGIQDREQQPARRVRPVQRRRHQPHDEVGGQRLPRQRVRVLPEQRAQRDELLPDGAADQAGLRPQPVRRHRRRPARQGPARSSSWTTRVSARRSAAR